MTWEESVWAHAEDLYDVVRPMLAELGVPLPFTPVRLGRGGYACVFATDDNRVVKFTSDHDERSSAELVRLRQLARGTHFKRIVKLDHVFDVQLLSWKYHTLIVGERLFKIDERHWPYYAPNIFIYNQYGPDRAPSKQEIAWAERYGEQLTGFAHSRLETIKGLTGVPNRQTLERVFSEMVDDLHEAGITGHTDLHYENVMKRLDGTLVISDLGCTESPQRVTPRFIQNGPLCESR